MPQPTLALTPQDTESKIPLVASPLRMVRDFHDKFGGDVDVPFTPETISLRFRLIEEEFMEVDNELFPHHAGPPDEKKLTKELADLLYVVYGTAVTFGLPLEEVFEEVHRSNMSKLGDDGKPIKREDGKILKGPNYKEPNLDKYFTV